ncbi:hypothetical protein KL933_000362 [Ogataea haglerorum]|uniref:Uncharacterized protein n=1 Tax=Ogataea haglerorum TaxID=1937702 RepID=A0AAN6I3E4_9ASCO|nr:hypothetical protein KL915_000979 [Ogataea haglerorum]KAG7711761.1 hypothetical protein KL914_000403 [Ogataea haglerorum]KAG7722585.1 hypothetical protein KL913_000405 [Ogataea haglerorum]KAG7723313.1 hypothetical protein KL949_000363 [Ogataea haglerorum]KAG7730567.1 hypothetical protein KL933_000362 [Ogataea haglerorum]
MLERARTVHRFVSQLRLGSKHRQSFWKKPSSNTTVSETIQTTNKSPANTVLTDGVDTSKEAAANTLLHVESTEMSFISVEHDLGDLSEQFYLVPSSERNVPSKQQSESSSTYSDSFNFEWVNDIISMYMTYESEVPKSALLEADYEYYSSFL